MEIEKVKEILRRNRKKHYTDKEVKELMKFLNILKDVSISNLSKLTKT